MKPDVLNILPLTSESKCDLKNRIKSEVDDDTSTSFEQVCFKDLQNCVQTITHRNYLKYAHTCNLCNKRYISMKCLEKHLMQHLSETSLASLARIESIIDLKSIRKDRCGEKKIGRKNIKINKIKTPCSCDVCGKSFKFKSGLKIHYTKHTKLKNYHCYDCGKAFVSKGYLKEHNVLHSIYTNSSKSGLPVVCDLCNQHFFKMVNIKSHMCWHLRGKCHSKIAQRGSSKKSNRKKTFICEVCGKSYSSKYRLKQHDSFHSKVKLYLCDLCGRSYASKKNLNRHSIEHSGKKQYSCEDCDLSFFNRHALNQHRVVHIKVKNHKCNVCGKSFSVSAYLKMHHLRVHTNDNLFQCEHCNKSFHLKSLLNHHLTVHTTARPFVCTICGKLFKRRASLRDHLLRHKKRNQVPLD